MRSWIYAFFFLVGLQQLFDVKSLRLDSFLILLGHRPSWAPLQGLTGFTANNLSLPPNSTRPLKAVRSPRRGVQTRQSCQRRK